jgi:hypothetical protein
MKIINIQSSTSLLKATTPDVIVKTEYNNHRVVLRSDIGTQTVSAAYSEIITIQYEKDLIATVIENSDV